MTSDNSGIEDQFVWQELAWETRVVTSHAMLDDGISMDSMALCREACLTSVRALVCA